MKIRNRGLAASQKRACVNLDVMRIKGLAWLGKRLHPVAELNYVQERQIAITAVAGQDDRPLVVSGGHDGYVQILDLTGALS